MTCQTAGQDHDPHSHLDLIDAALLKAARLVIAQQVAGSQFAESSVGRLRVEKHTPTGSVTRHMRSSDVSKKDPPRGRADSCLCSQRR